MSRLTKREEYMTPIYYSLNLSSKGKTYMDFVLEEQELQNEMTQKLGKLEDLEEELGCPLDKFIQVLCDWGFSDENNMGVQINGMALNGDGSICFSAVNGDLYDLKDYKKTWWLRGERDEKES